MANLGRRFDFQIGGKGFMLSRAGQFKGRAWTRTGRADTPGQRSSEDLKFGALPDELDHPEVWNDWSGGFGHAYRRTGEPTYHWAENFDGRFPQQLVHCQAFVPAQGTTGTLFGNVENLSVMPTQFWGSNVINVEVLVIGGGRPVKLIPNDVTSSAKFIGDNAFTPTFNLSYGVRAATYGSFTYLPNVDGSAFWQQPHYSTVGAGGTLADTPAMAFAVAGNTLWRAHGVGRGATYLQSISNAAPGAVLSAPNWSATLNIGGGYGVSDLAVLEDQVMVGMPDGVYAGDASGTFVNIFPELANQVHPDNCRDLVVYDGSLITQHVAGIFAYQPQGYTAVVEDISPAMGRSPIQGFSRALANHGRWLYAGVWTGSQSYILVGSRRGGQFIWQTLHRLPSISQVHRMFFDGIELGGVTGDLGSTLHVPERFWVATNASVNTTGSAPLYVAQVPRMNGNPLIADPVFSANYIGSARMDLGSIDWDAPGTPKIFRSVEVWADNMASGAVWCQIYYDIDHSGSFALLGTSAKSPKDTLFFPSGEGSFITGQSLELSLRSFTATSGQTPVYRAIIPRGALQPRSVDMITAVTRIADNIRDRQGNDMRSGATMLQELRDFGNPDVNGLQAHQLIDLAGATQWVKVLGRVEEQEVYQQSEEYPEIAATVKMAVLTFS